MACIGVVLPGTDGIFYTSANIRAEKQRKSLISNNIHDWYSDCFGKKLIHLPDPTKEKS
jgi:hypothetical protein